MKSVMALALAGSGVAVSQDAVQWRVEDGGNGHWYGFVDSSLNWLEANDEATSFNGHLATLTSASENEFAKQLVASIDPSNNAAHLGGRSTGPGDDLSSWYWITGEPWEFTDWCCSNPSLYPNERALAFDGGLLGWNNIHYPGDGDPVPSHGYLIEWSSDCNSDGIVDYGQIVDGTLKDYDHDNIPDICEAVEWPVSDGGNGHWYFSFQSEVPLSAEGHFSEAELLSGHTITITSSEENEIGFGVDEGRGSFIGLRKQAGNNVPTWVTGEEMTYLNWYPGEGGNSHEKYAKYWDQTFPPSSGWLDTDLTERSFSVIEFEADCNNDGLVDFGQIITGELVDNDDNAVPDCCESDVSCGPDCDQDGISDEDEIADGSASDFNSNGVPDNCEADCDADGIADFIEIDQGIEFDCNFNAIPDGCELVDGSAEDANGNTFLDACEIDCNGNGVFDFLDLFAGSEQDCTGNGVPDSCDIDAGIEADCDLNGVPDSCEIFDDCDSNGIPDFCDPDCDSDGTPDACEGSEDCDANGVPDDCQADTDTDGTIDACDPDDDGDGIEDGCDVDNTMGEDCDLNGIDDTCDPDFDGDLIPDACDEDDDGDGIEDQCDVDSFAIPAEALRWEEVGGGNGHYYQLIISETGSFTLEEALEQVPLGASLVTITSPEEHQFTAFVVAEPIEAWTNESSGPPVRGPLIGLLRIQGCEYGWVTGEEFEYERWHPGNPNNCEVSPFVQLWDRGPRNWQNSGGLFNSFIIEWSSNPQDCNSNGIVDGCELETSDCNANGIPDDCDGLADCNANGIGDVCDIDSGTSIDVNLDGIPDECQCVPDIVIDGVVDFTDLLTLLNEYGPCPPPCRSDLNGDGVVNFADILQLLSAWGACE
ncbi:MAG: hypothetical protein VX104_07205 [Planctomycetota bacterium]|nr:hypothetical protein [Planctomycetota bacterium]